MSLDNDKCNLAVAAAIEASDRFEDHRGAMKWRGLGAIYGNDGCR